MKGKISDKSKENVEIAREHLNLAKELIVDEGKKQDSEEISKEFEEAAFALEKAESEVEDIEDL